LSSLLYFIFPLSYHLSSLPFRPLNPPILSVPLFLPAETTSDAYENYTVQSIQKSVRRTNFNLNVNKNVFSRYGK
jgi:hypothetical protein